MLHYEKVKRYMNENLMIDKDESVIVGLSGGADSVCLFLMLVKYFVNERHRLRAVHVHHGIRGAEADRDMEFVKKLCKKYDVELVIYRYNIPEYAAHNHMTHEEAGRILRYQSFNEAGAGGKYKIAVAHNANDNAETVIHNMCRGSGLKGLGGILPLNGNIIRPVLCLSRKQIEESVKSAGEEFITDSTNLGEEYTRNKIRHRVLPYLENEINDRSMEHICNAAENAREAEKFLDNLTYKMYENIVTTDNNYIYLSKDKLCKMERYMAMRVIRMAVGNAAGRLKDISTVHIESIYQLNELQTGSRIDLPYGICAMNEYEKISLFVRTDKKENAHRIENTEKTSNTENTEKTSNTENTEKTSNTENTEKTSNTHIEYCEYEKKHLSGSSSSIIIDGQGNYKLPGSRYTFSVKIINVDKDNIDIKKLEKTIKNEEIVYTKWFDYDKIKFTVQLRYRENGDYITIGKECRHKKLKAFFIDSKILRTDRDTIPLVTDGSHVIWVTGMRISEEYKITENTKNILKIEMKG